MSLPVGNFNRHGHSRRSSWSDSTDDYENEILLHSSPSPSPGQPATATAANSPVPDFSQLIANLNLNQKFSALKPSNLNRLPLLAVTFVRYCRLHFVLLLVGLVCFSTALLFFLSTLIAGQTPSDPIIPVTFIPIRQQLFIRSPLPELNSSFELTVSLHPRLSLTHNKTFAASSLVPMMDDAIAEQLRTILLETNRHVALQMLMERMTPELLRRPDVSCQLQSNTKNSSFDDAYPNLVHYIRFFPNQSVAELDFLQFVSIVSAEHFLKPDVIYLWGNIEPHGYYYDMLHHYVRCLKWMHVEPVKQLSKKNVTLSEHAADYEKLRSIYAYGGIVVDFDVIFINGTKLRREQRAHECVVACESKCKLINMGIVSCRRHSPFIALWMKGHEHHYQPAKWTFNSGAYPTRMLATGTYNRTLIYFDPRAGQQPQWNERRWWLLNGNAVPQWREKAMTHHYLKMSHLHKWVNATMPDFEFLLMRNSFGQLLRHVFNIKLDDVTA